MMPPEGALHPRTFAPRERLGPYELLMELARGGVATAIVARKVGAPGFERLVVVKRVHRKLLANADFGAMFRDEARLASAIVHPNVASVIDVVEAGTELCLVMEYFEALSLAELSVAAGAGRRVSPRVAVRILVDTLRGLDAAHDATDERGQPLGIVHRDVSPHNVISDIEGVSRVIDFGIAKAESRLTKTRNGIVKGKLAYMAPEQIDAQVVDRRSDVFAAGVLLHELLTGRPLFAHEDEFEIIRRVLAGDVPPPSRISTDLPPALDAVVGQALARSPDARFASARAFEAALVQAIAPASARDVAAWVSSVGGATLGRRRTEILALLMAAHGSG
jgi:eukaryotic-like serine/threonine-protein kinase